MTDKPGWVKVASSDDLSVTPEEASSLETMSRPQLEAVRVRAVEDVLTVARRIHDDMRKPPKFEMTGPTAFLLGMALGRMKTIDDKLGGHDAEGPTNPTRDN